MQRTGARAQGRIGGHRQRAAEQVGAAGVGVVAFEHQRAATGLAQHAAGAVLDARGHRGRHPGIDVEAAARGRRHAQGVALDPVSVGGELQGVEPLRVLHGHRARGAGEHAHRTAPAGIGSAVGVGPVGSEALPEAVTAIHGAVAGGVAAIPELHRLAGAQDHQVDLAGHVVAQVGAAGRGLEARGAGHRASGERAGQGAAVMEQAVMAGRGHPGVELAIQRQIAGHLHQVVAASPRPTGHAGAVELEHGARAGFQHQVAIHLQRARAVARRERATGLHAGVGDRAAAAERTAVLHRDVAAKRAIDQQRAARHRGGAGKARAVAGQGGGTGEVVQGVRAGIGAQEYGAEGNVVRVVEHQRRLAGTELHPFAVEDAGGLGSLSGGSADVERAAGACMAGQPDHVPFGCAARSRARLHATAAGQGEAAFAAFVLA
ncbi:hypothetical protein L599_006500000010, partial [Luteimonas sp. J16]